MLPAEQQKSVPNTSCDQWRCHAPFGQQRARRLAELVARLSWRRVTIELGDPPVVEFIVKCPWGSPF